MHGWFKWCNAVYWIGLTIWVAAIFSAGAAAMGVFTVLPSAGVHVDRFEAAFRDDTATQGRVLGGMVMEPIFAATDWVQAGAAVAVIVALMLQFVAFGMRWRSPANLIRSLCIEAAALLMIVHMITFAPRMNRELRQSWHAAEAGDTETWREHRTAFESDHVLANRLFNVRFVLLLVAVGASAAALTPTRPQQPATPLPNLVR